jgi:hypothetical protein
MLRFLCIALLCPLLLALLTGCSTPNSSWSKERIQAWADRSFPVGSTREQVGARLKELGVRPSRGHVTYDPKDPEPVYFFHSPWYDSPLLRLSLVVNEAGVRFHFDSRDLLNRVEAIKSRAGP